MRNTRAAIPNPNQKVVFAYSLFASRRIDLKDLHRKIGFGNSISSLVLDNQSGINHYCFLRNVTVLQGLISKVQKYYYVT